MDEEYMISGQYLLTRVLLVSQHSEVEQNIVVSIFIESAPRSVHSRIICPLEE
jgi:negative regulator of genetic competence, sporulation and motility